jgi:hypothetical protein
MGSSKIKFYGQADLVRKISSNANVTPLEISFDNKLFFFLDLSCRFEQSAHTTHLIAIT